MPSNDPPRSPAVRQLCPPTRLTPLPDVSHAVLAEVQDDVAGLALEDVADQLVRLLKRGSVRVLDELAVRAPVILQEVEAPRDELLHVLLLVLIGADVPTAGERPRRGVNARLEPLGMDVIGQALHVRKPAVGVDSPLGVAGLAPQFTHRMRRA